MIPNQEEMLSAYANGELSRTQREFVDGHLSGCAECREVLADHGWARQGLTALATQPMQVDIAQATMARLAGDRGRPSSGRRVPRLAFAAGAAVAVLIATAVVQFAIPNAGGPLEKVYAAFQGIQSYRMTGTTTSSANGETTTSAFEWAYQARDRLAGTLTTNGEERAFILIDGFQYMRTNSSGAPNGFVSIVTDSIFDPVPSREGTLTLLDSLHDFEKLPEGDIDGATALRFRGRVDTDDTFDELAASLDPSDPNYVRTMENVELQKQMTLDIELWVDPSTFVMRRLLISGSAPTVGPEGDGYAIFGWMIWETTVSFFDIDGDIVIDHPRTANGELEPGWSGDSGGDGPPPVVQFESR